MIAQRIGMITLGVHDIKKSRIFYEKIGFQETSGGNEKIAFYKLNGQFFALYCAKALATDLHMPIHKRSTGAITLATNYDSPQKVDTAYAKALEAGAICIVKPEKTFWGGYSGYYTDPDGHLWEIAHNPFWTLDHDGNIINDSA